MFWDKVAGVYDILVNIINRKTHKELNADTYRQFFLDAGYSDVQVKMAEGRIPCAVAIMTKNKSDSEEQPNKAKKNHR